MARGHGRRRQRRVVAGGAARRCSATSIARARSLSTDARGQSVDARENCTGSPVVPRTAVVTNRVAVMCALPRPAPRLYGRAAGGTRSGRPRWFTQVPTLVNAAWATSLFWDGRASTLEQQVLQPVFSPREIAATPDDVMAVVRSQKFRPAFVTAFRSEPTIFDVGRALASYVRTIEAGDAPYDRYLAGDARALNDAAQRGFILFNGKARCVVCHGGPLLSDGRFHNTGVAWRTGVLTDEGRARVTQRPTDRGAFKTPTLREVARTSPYMHDGSLGTLQDVIEFYDRGGVANPGLDVRLRPLRLTASEKASLAALLRSLSGTVRDRVER